MTSAQLVAEVDGVTASDLYFQMAVIRRFEQLAYRAYEKNEVYGTVHVGIGQEAVAVGVISVLGKSDQVLSHHRGHAHALAKGVDPGRLMAELCGRSTGVSGGRGGSMHATDVGSGFLGTMAIVGSAIPLAVGVALANKFLGSQRVCVAFFGDGAVNQGVLYEAMNLAKLWSLPVVFVCENNGYAITTSASDSIAGEGVVARARAFGLVSESVDGQDVFAVRDAAVRLVDRAREGEPALLEAITYRFLGHSRGDPTHGVYRSKEEVDAWKRRDPLTVLAANTQMGTEVVEKLDAAAKVVADSALEFALGSSFPDAEDLTIGLPR